MPCDDRIAPPGTMDAGRTTMDELRHALRLGTRTAHERLERCFGAFNLTRHADYAAFLRAQAAALVRLEAGALHEREPSARLGLGKGNVIPR